MSRPRLHESLLALFELKNPEHLQSVVGHPVYADFMKTHGIELGIEELPQAFIHKSFFHEFGLAHQEQLEFLGDAVLQLLLTEELYRLYPQEKEGKLSKLRSSIVNEKSLATIARGLGLNEMIIVGKGEYKKNLFTQDAVLADTFEAILAVIYRKNGLDFTRSLFFRWLHQYLPDAMNSNLEDFDWKSKLQEATLAKYKSLPKYVSTEVDKGFRVELWIEEKKVQEGVFLSKKNGEKELAESAIKKSLV